MSQPDIDRLDDSQETSAPGTYPLLLTAGQQI